MKAAALYICYYHVTEPLVQAQVVAYLEELAKQKIEIHLLTFERHPLSPKARRAFRLDLAARGITWHTLFYHQRPSLLATLYDIALGAWTAMRICCKHHIRLIHARSHVPAAMALILKRMLNCSFLFDFRGLMAEEYADSGHWQVGELKYRLVKGMERIFFRRADGIVVLTHAIKDQFAASGVLPSPSETAVTVIPCCVNVERFRVPDADRLAWRSQRGWTGRLVLTYLGKLSDLYLPTAMARFFAVAYQTDPRFFFQILTQSDPTPLADALRRARVPAAAYSFGFAAPQQLPLTLAASNASISFRKGEYSKLAASPTKLGECLAAGLPVVTNSGIGDCDGLIEGHELGIVLREFSDAEFSRGAKALCRLLADPNIASRCRQWAEQELSLSGVGGPRYLAVYKHCLASRSPNVIDKRSAALPRPLLQSTRL